MNKIYYGKAVYDNKEINAVLNVLKNHGLSLIDGPHVKKLEKTVARMFGKKYGLMVNSGSSANLLGLSSFKFKKGSEVITPSLTFATTVAPIYQLGLIPYFIGAVENKFLADLCKFFQFLTILTPKLDPSFTGLSTIGNLIFFFEINFFKNLF